MIAEVGRLQDRRAAATTSWLRSRLPECAAIEYALQNLTDPKTTLACSQLVTRKAAAQAELTRMKQELREKHPDVIAKQKEIDQVQEYMDPMIADWKDKIKEKEERLRKILTWLCRGRNRKSS